MACDDAITSPGVTFLYDLDGTPPFTDIGDVIDISGPGVTIESKEKTTLASAARFKEFCPGFGDGGEVTFNVLMKKAKVTALKTLWFVVFYGRLQWPLQDGESTPSYWEFTCFITNHGEEHPEDGGRCTIPVTTKISGEPDFTEGA